MSLCQEYVSPYFKVEGKVIDVRKITQINCRYVYFSSVDFCLELDEVSFEKLLEHIEIFAQQESNYGVINETIRALTEKIVGRFEGVEKRILGIERFLIELNEDINKSNKE